MPTKKQEIRTVIKENQEPQPIEVLESSIVEIAKAMKVINSTRLTRRSLVALLHDNSKLPKRDIEIVLNNLDQLEELFLKKKV